MAAGIAPGVWGNPGMIALTFFRGWEAAKAAVEQQIVNDFQPASKEERRAE